MSVTLRAEYRSSTSTTAPRRNVTGEEERRPASIDGGVFQTSYWDPGAFAFRAPVQPSAQIGTSGRGSIHPRFGATSTFFARMHDPEPRVSLARCVREHRGMEAPRPRAPRTLAGATASKWGRPSLLPALVVLGTFACSDGAAGSSVSDTGHGGGSGAGAAGADSASSAGGSARGGATGASGAKGPDAGGSAGDAAGGRSTTGGASGRPSGGAAGNPLSGGAGGQPADGGATGKPCRDASGRWVPELKAGSGEAGCTMIPRYSCCGPGPVYGLANG